MLYLTFDIWHRYLPCYTWHLIYDTATCHAILDTWYITPVLDMLYLTPNTWHLYYMAYSWLSLFRGLGMIIILLPDIWYSWTPVLLNSCTPEPLYSWTLVSPVLMSPALLLLLIAQSDWRPTEHAWCRDDEDVSHDRASVRRILNGTKCHME